MWSIKRLAGLSYIALVSSGVFNTAHAQVGPKVDPSNFDVAGVNLKMSVSEVIESLKKKYEVSESDIRVVKAEHPDLGSVVRNLSLRSPDAEKGYSASGTLSKGWEVRVSFVPVVPFKDKDVHAYRINYEIANTKENSEAITQAAIEKYGEPSIPPGQIGQPVLWCEKPTANWGLPGGDCGSSEVVLQTTGSQLTLFDESLRQAAIAGSDDVNAEKPKF